MAKICGKELSGKQTYLFAGLFILVWYGGMSVIAYYSIDAIIEATEYNNEATTQQCLIISRIESDCQYDCGTDDSGCYATQYDYKAIVEDKCGNNQTLDFNPREARICPGEYRDVNEYTNCYVLDCNDNEFSFVHSSKVMGYGIAGIVIAALFMLCPLWCERDVIWEKCRDCKKSPETSETSEQPNNV